MEDANRFRVALVLGTLALAAYLFFYNLGGTSLISSEATHAMVARCLLKKERLYPLCIQSFTKNKMHLYCGGKEPLKFWVEALLFKISPPSEWTARIIDASLGMATILLLLIVGGSLLGWETGVLAALIVLAFPPIILNHCFRSGTQDSLVVFSYASALLGYLWYRLRGSKVAIILATLAVMVGLMTKDIFLLSVYPSIILAETVAFRKGLKHLMSPPLLLFFIVPVVSYLLWLVFVYFSTHGACIKHLLKDEFVRPALGQVSSRAKYYKGPLFYLGILVKYLGPILAAPLMQLVPSFRSLRKRERKETAYQVAAFLLFAAICYLVLVSIPALKVKRYIYPVYPILALSLSYYVAEAFRLTPSVLVKATVALLVGGFLTINILYASSKITRHRELPSSKFLKHYRSLKGPKTFILEYPGVKDVDSHDSFYLSFIPYIVRVPYGEMKKELEGERFRGTVAILTSQPQLYRGLPGLQVVRVWDMRKRKKKKLKYVILEAVLRPHTSNQGEEQP